jgi:hypothetical protein
VGNWKTGVTMADVNGDGYLDIFVCGVGNYKMFTGRNQLLLNNGDLTFSDKTDEYGLNFQGFSTQASFFDYDNDGDLDMYLVNHSVHTRRSYGHASLRYERDSLAGDKLYENEWIPHGKHHFVEVTERAGILSSHIGYGLSAGISDLNLMATSIFMFPMISMRTTTSILTKKTGRLSRNWKNPYRIRVVFPWVAISPTLIMTD